MQTYSLNNQKKYYYTKHNAARRRSIFVKQNQNAGSAVAPRREKQNGAGLFFAGIAALALVVSTGFLYLSQITSSAVHGYDSSSLEKKVAVLQEERRNLEMRAADLQSVHLLSREARENNMVPAGDAKFTSAASNGTMAFLADNDGLQ